MTPTLAVGPGDTETYFRGSDARNVRRRMRVRQLQFRPNLFQDPSYRYRLRSVTAPALAVLTVAAYLARTPRT